MYMPSTHVRVTRIDSRDTMGLKMSCEVTSNVTLFRQAPSGFVVKHPPIFSGFPLKKNSSLMPRQYIT